MPAPSRPVVMGRVLWAYGVRGWVKVQAFTEQPEALKEFPRWWLAKSGEWREVQVEECSAHGAYLVARFAGCHSPEEAARYRGSEIAVPRETLPDPGTDRYYETDLIGLRVLNQAGEELGRIDSILENGAHAVMRVRWEGGERLVPWVESVVRSVELEAGEVRVDWGIDW